MILEIPPTLLCMRTFPGLFLNYKLINVFTCTKTNFVWPQLFLSVLIFAFVTQNMVYLCECSTYSWKECIFCGCWVECSINVSEVTPSKFYQLLRGALGITDSTCGVFYFSLWVYHILLHLFWRSVIRCINCQDVLLLNWLQYHCAVTFFIPSNVLYSEINRVLILM